MKSKYTALAIVATAFMSLVWSAVDISAGPATPPSSTSPDQAKYVYNFTNTVRPWEPFAALLPTDEHTLVLKAEPSGNSYASLATGGADGVWMMSSFPGVGNTASVVFQARLVEGITSVQPIIYVGTAKPSGLSDFERIGQPLTSQWQSYWLMRPMQGSTIVVALGYIADGPTWTGIDNLAVRLLEQ